MPNLDCIDISHYQPEPDWAAVYASGCKAVILKCTEGTGYTDPTFAKRYQRAKAAGFKVSSYHFLHGGEIDAQMKYYLAQAAPEQGSRVCIDHEADASLDELIQAVQFIRTNRPDLQVTVYSGHLIKEQLGDDPCDYLTENTSLWLAEYCEYPSWPAHVWPYYSLWQFSDNGSVPGIDGPVDANEFNGTTEHMLDWFGPVEPAPAPEPAPEPKPEPGDRVIISVTVPAGIPVEIRVNNQTVLVA